ncbi:hypothetical protein E8E11_009858 [Didymella keratinophila]|nr:hypothetical protein E8E11_009858 [Didymella keratinophila]
MSLPSARRRLRFFRRDSLKRRKTAHDEVTVQPGDDIVSPSVVSSEAIVNKNQSTVPAVRRTPSPSRPKFGTLLSQTSKLFSLATHRKDSIILTSKDTRNGLKRALEDANHMVAGPNGEVLPAYVINDFFKLNSAGGSDWQQSWQWEAHLDRWEGHKTHRSIGNQVYCDYCRELWKRKHELPPPYVPLSQPASSRSSSLDHSSASEPRGSEGNHLSISIWPPGIRRRKEKGKEKGKEIATDETCYDAPHEMSISPRTHASEQQLISPRARASDRELVRCSISAKPVDLNQKRTPAARNFSKDCIPLGLSGPSHLTGRPHGASPLQGDHLPLPLPRNAQPPPAPELKPAQRHTPIPGSFHLEDPSGLSTDAAFQPNSRGRRDSNAIEVIRGDFRESITLVNTSSTTAQDAMCVFLSQYRHEAPAAKLQKRRPRHRSPSPNRRPLPTPPTSRSNSDSNQSGMADVPEITFGATGSLPARPAGPRRRTTGTASTTGPADRDTRVCTLSDTTGSPLPECRTYVDTQEKKTRKNEEARKRHWSGMFHWRYRTESEPED